MGSIRSITSLEIESVKVISLNIHSDFRGTNIKIFSSNELAEAGIAFEPLEVLAIHSNANTLRGFHYQKECEQSRIVLCTKGKLFVAIVDCGNPDIKCEYILERADEAIFVPCGYALATLAVVDSDFLCLCAENVYRPEFSAGFAWNDSKINILWPCINELLLISDADRNLPCF